MRRQTHKTGIELMAAVALVLLLTALFAHHVSDPTPAQATSSAAQVRFAVIGDYGDGSVDEARVAELVASWDPDFVVTTGDNNYPDGEASTIDEHIGQFYSAFIGDYQGSYGSGSPVNRFWPSLGNHDWRSLSCSGSDCSGPYFDYFTLPGNERYYEVNFGLVGLFIIDTVDSEPDGVTETSTQAGWLQDRLAASTACFDIVAMHYPPYSSGNHGSTKDARWPYGDWGAEMVLSGHEHSYERLDVGGLPYIVNGSGGDSLRDFVHLGELPPEATSIVRYNDDYGAMLVTATETGLQSQFYNAEGVLIDDVTFAKDCPVTPPSTPPPPGPLLDPVIYLPLTSS